MSWGTWPDVLVDFGQQLYIPWRLSQGEVLYRDLPYLHGPLSQYTGALLFRVFGPSLTALALFNLAVAGAVLGLVVAIGRRLGGELSGAVAGLLFATLFAFAQLLPTGNYNFVTPYVQETVHGLALGLLAVHLAARAAEAARPHPGAKPGALAFARLAAFAGLAVGLCFLTKAECFVAAALGCAATLGRRHVVTAFAGLLVPPSLAFLLFLTAMPAGEALGATLGPFRPALYGSGVTALPFFRQSLGIDAPVANLLRLGAIAAGWAAVLGPAYLVSKATPARRERAVAVAAYAVTAGGLLALRDVIPWSELARPLPLFAALLVAACWRASPLHRGAAVFALALLLKIALNSRLHHYGFFLAMPATLLVAGALVGRAAPGPAFRAAALGGLSAVAAVHLQRSTGFWLGKTVPVGRGGDRFLADARGQLVNGALAELERRAGPGETLAAVPEGAILGYLGRRRNPTGFTTLTPVEIQAFGEETVVRAFEKRPPDWVALVHKDTTEFGAPFFGRDYAPRLGRLLARDYQPVALAGEPPLERPGQLGIRLLRRRRP